MAKGSGGTRSSGPVKGAAEKYILAYTSKGGPDYRFFSAYDTPENREAFFDYLDSAQKLNGETVYRGSHLLAGDIERIITGEYQPGDEFPASLIGKSPDGTFSFSRDATRTLGYGGVMPKPNPNYDRFGNEVMRVRFEVETTGKGTVDIANKSHYKEELEAVAKATSKYTYVGAEYRNNGGFWVIKLKEK